MKIKSVALILLFVAASTSAAYGRSAVGLPDIIWAGCDTSVLIANDCVIEFMPVDEYDPIASGEVDPWEVYEAEQIEAADKAMAEEAQRAWMEENEPPYDISDSPIKP